MDAAATLELPEADYRAIRSHVLPSWSRHEEAVFMFARSARSGVFAPVEWMHVAPDGFTHRSAHYLELTDETRAAVIKRAHDLSASIIEIHSHPLQEEAVFSPSDRRGFLDFVPHVLWRLKGRPYGAVVMTADSFGGLAWFSDVHSPKPLAIELDSGVVLHPTGITFSTWTEWSDNYEQGTI